MDNDANTATLADLRAAVAQLPSELHPSASSLLGRRFEVEGHFLEFDELNPWRAAAKYGQAVMHVAAMFRYLRQARNNQAVELEVSIDETATPTSPAEHLHRACELRRLGVDWVSLAPRFVGQ